MKTKRTTGPRPHPPPEAAALHDAQMPLGTMAPPAPVGPMVRTQIYLQRREHEFLQAEATRRGEPMAAVIRTLIQEKMELPTEAWAHNPMLAPTAQDPTWEGHEDGAINHDHYVHRSPKKYEKRGQRWVPAPPLPADYYSGPGGRG